jgi:hypothetical protein
VGGLGLEAGFEGVNLLLEGDDVEGELFYFFYEGFLSGDEGDALMAYF